MAATSRSRSFPPEFAADPERFARFDREAKVLASLNHPNIAAIHGFHEAGGIRFLAMEMVPGEGLDQRISRGAIPAEEAKGIALEIAEALEYAHERGTATGKLMIQDIATLERREVDVTLPLPPDADFIVVVSPDGRTSCRRRWPRSGAAAARQPSSGAT